MNDHLTRIQFELTRVADALERIASAIEGDQVENIITVSPGPFVWDDVKGTFVQDAEEAPGTAQTTWDWLGITPTKGRQPGRPSHCGRCGREGTRRMNHANHCRECRHEAWWDE